MTKAEQHAAICAELNDTYRKKNADYGDSFGETFRKLGMISAVTRITDKTNRLQSLSVHAAQVKDEALRDTLLDLANYAIMSMIELQNEAERRPNT